MQLPLAIFGLCFWLSLWTPVLSAGEQAPVSGQAPTPPSARYMTARTLRGAGLNRTVDLAIHMRTHSLYPPYVDSDLQNRWFSFGADAYVNTNKHIRLTRGVPSQCGWVWSRLPIAAQNWRMDFEFKISGKQTHLYGDGMAIWLTTERAQEGPVFCSKDLFNGLGIVIDTYSNAKHTYAFPRVMAMLGDGKTKYDQANDGKANAIAACSAKVRKTDITTKLRLTYFRDDFLQVQLQYKGFDEWTDCFVIKNISIPLNPFIGVTAQTGDVFDEHDLVSITTHSTILKRSAPSIASAETSKSSGSFWGGFLKLLLFGAVCAVGYAGFRAYQAKQGRPWDAKRF